LSYFFVFLFRTLIAVALEIHSKSNYINVFVQKVENCFFIFGKTVDFFRYKPSFVQDQIKKYQEKYLFQTIMLKLLT